MNPLREERKLLKQKLFSIRRHVGGEHVRLTPELRELKSFYESLPNFTKWSDFPEKWDVGDPNSVKKNSVTFNDVDKANREKILGKSYETIVHLVYEDE